VFQENPLIWQGYAVAQLVEALRVRFPMGSFGFFIDLILGLAQPLTEMSTRDVSCGGGRVKAAGG